MIDQKRLIFLHGLESSSQSSKAVLLRQLFPGMLTPDFSGSLEQRMAQLYPILSSQRDWLIIGSSFGGLMGALFTCQHPKQVKKLILLAPALSLPEFADHPPEPVSVPTVIIHGRQDQVVQPEPVRRLAEQVFKNLTYQPVDDEHRLHETAQKLDWRALLEET
jgi:pimeloyl-ACP methyl ester carboxylesterase